MQNPPEFSENTRIDENHDGGASIPDDNYTRSFVDPSFPMTVGDENPDGEATELFENEAGTESQSRSVIDQSSSSRRTKRSECSSSHRDLTVVSSLSSSSSSSREDISSIVSVGGEADEKGDDEIEVFVSEIVSDNNNTVGKDESETISEINEQWGSPGATGGDHYENSDGFDYEENTDSLAREWNKSRPSRCEDFESDESEFEEDEILIVLRKKRKELIQKLWLIDKFINKKS